MDVEDSGRVGCVQGGGVRGFGQCVPSGAAEDAMPSGAVTGVISGGEWVAHAPDAAAAPLAEVAVVQEVVPVATGAVKRKRGRPAKGQPKAPPKKVKDEEDVCFICFDGGKLVLCDRRTCPKAYHPACIKRDEAFFRSKAQWNCGLHICSSCEKAARYMCYTCTYSLCKVCISVAEFFCVRGNQGFCTTCMRMIRLIENNVEGDEEMVKVDFDDQTSWEYLFKMYWIYLKEKLLLTLEELDNARNPWKGASVLSFQGGSSGELYDASSISDVSSRKKYVSKRKMEKQIKFPSKKDAQNMVKPVVYGRTSFPEGAQWASKELLEFIAYMRDGDTSILSQFEVQTLLFEYIKKNNLRDSRRKTQIICDLRLGKLFGKARVGHFEMLKLLEFHFLRKLDSQVDCGQGGFVATSTTEVDADGNNDNQLIKHKTCYGRGSQTNFAEYAAIDVHNVNLIYLRRSLMGNLIEDAENFSEKVIGAIVRIRTISEDKKHDMYRLVQVLGTRKAAVPYKVGQRMTDFMLEILNLNKKEAISIDAISNQEFSEDECKHLCQSMKCGLNKHLTVDEIQDKAMALSKVKLAACLESEISRLSHLRDLASVKGQEKELRECIEKLELLNAPEELSRRLQEIPEVHAAPCMGPAYEPEEIVGELDEPEEIVGELDEKREGTSSKSENLENSVGPASLATLDSKDCALSRHESPEPPEPPEPSPVVAAETLTTVLSSETGLEVDKIWNYQDPSGKIQGPFCTGELRQWGLCGFFPHDLKVWRTGETRDDSRLLADVLDGLCSEKPSQLLKDGVDLDVKKNYHEMTLMDEKQIEGADWEMPVDFSHLEKKHNGSFPGVCDLNGFDQPRVPSSVPSPTLPCESSLQPDNEGHEGEAIDSSHDHEHNTGVPTVSEHPGQPHLSVSPEGWDSNSTIAKSSETPEQPHVHGFADLPSAAPDQNDLNEKDQIAENRTSVAPNTPAGSSWGSASSLVGNGDPNPEMGGEWGGGHSPNSAKPSAVEWETGLVSATVLTLSEASHEHAAATPTSNAGPHPALPSASNWQALVSGPNEFTSLGEESVSDLLAEVDAMEFNGLPSPTSMMNCTTEFAQVSKTDCFSSIEVLSPSLGPGKTDALSSTADLQFPFKLALLDEHQHQGFVHPHVLDAQDNSKTGDVSVPPAPSSKSWETGMIHSAWRASEAESDHGHASLGWDMGPVQRDRGLGLGGMVVTNNHNHLDWGSVSKMVSESKGILGNGNLDWGMAPGKGNDHHHGALAGNQDTRESRQNQQLDWGSVSKMVSESKGVSGNDTLDRGMAPGKGNEHHHGALAGNQDTGESRQPRQLDWGSFSKMVSESKDILGNDNLDWGMAPGKGNDHHHGSPAGNRDACDSKPKCTESGHHRDVDWGSVSESKGILGNSNPDQGMAPGKGNENRVMGDNQNKCTESRHNRRLDWGSVSVGKGMLGNSNLDWGMLPGKGDDHHHGTLAGNRDACDSQTKCSDSRQNRHLDWGMSPRKGNDHHHGAPAMNRDACDSQPKCTESRHHRHSGSRDREHQSRHSGNRDRGVPGRDHSSSRNRNSHRHSSGGGGSSSRHSPSRHSPRGSRVCKYHGTGQCRKGAFCDFFHP